MGDLTEGEVGLDGGVGKVGALKLEGKSLTTSEKVTVTGANKQREKRRRRRPERRVGSANTGLLSRGKELWTLPLEATGSQPHSRRKGVAWSLCVFQRSLRAPTHRWGGAGEMPVLRSGSGGNNSSLDHGVGSGERAKRKDSKSTLEAEEPEAGGRFSVAGPREKG